VCVGGHLLLVAVVPDHPNRSCLLVCILLVLFPDGQKFGDVDTSSVGGMFSSLRSSTTAKTANAAPVAPAPVRKNPFAPPVRGMAAAAAQDPVEPEEPEEDGEWAEALHDYASQVYSMSPFSLFFDIYLSRVPLPHRKRLISRFLRVREYSSLKERQSTGTLPIFLFPPKFHLSSFIPLFLLPSQVDRRGGRKERPISSFIRQDIVSFSRSTNFKGILLAWRRDF
jgi:hypothetical protein